MFITISIEGRVINYDELVRSSEGGYSFIPAKVGREAKFQCYPVFPKDSGCRIKPGMAFE